MESIGKGFPGPLANGKPQNHMNIKGNLPSQECLQDRSQFAKGSGFFKTHLEPCPLSLHMNVILYIMLFGTSFMEAVYLFILWARDLDTHTNFILYDWELRVIFVWATKKWYKKQEKKVWEFWFLFESTVEKQVWCPFNQCLYFLFKESFKIHTHTNTHQIFIYHQYFAMHIY